MASSLGFREVKMPGLVTDGGDTQAESQQPAAGTPQPQSPQAPLALAIIRRRISGGGKNVTLGGRARGAGETARHVSSLRFYRLFYFGSSFGEIARVTS